MREDHTKDVSEGRKRDEDGKGALSANSKHVPEESSCYNAPGADYIGFGDGGKVGNLKVSVDEFAGEMRLTFASM